MLSGVDKLSGGRLFGGSHGSGGGGGGRGSRPWQKSASDEEPRPHKRQRAGSPPLPPRSLSDPGQHPMRRSHSASLMSGDGGQQAGGAAAAIAGSAAADEGFPGHNSVEDVHPAGKLVRLLTSFHCCVGSLQHCWRKPCWRRYRAGSVQVPASDHQSSLCLLAPWLPETHFAHHFDHTATCQVHAPLAGAMPGGVMACGQPLISCPCGVQLRQAKNASDTGADSTNYWAGKASPFPNQSCWNLLSLLLSAALRHILQTELRQRLLRFRCIPCSSPHDVLSPLCPPR